MKKLFLLLLPTVLLLAGNAEAQWQKGTKYWGATINFDGEFQRNENKYDKSDRTKTSNPAISPEAQLGWFVSGKTMLGIGLKYGFDFEKNDQRTLDNFTTDLRQSLKLLPFIRQYYALDDRWAVFIHGELGPQYSWSKHKNKGFIPSTSKSDYWQYGLSVKPGVVYTFPNKKWSVEAYTNFLSLDLNYLPFPDDDGGRQIQFATGFSTNFPAYFSLRIARYIQSKN
jgi:hypothetical protein